MFPGPQGMTEVSKVEPNNSMDQAQTVPINSAINGRSDGSNLDYNRFELKATTIVIDVEIQNWKCNWTATSPSLTEQGVRWLPTATTTDETRYRLRGAGRRRAYFLSFK